MKSSLKLKLSIPKIQNRQKKSSKKPSKTSDPNLTLKAIRLKAKIEDLKAKIEYDLTPFTKEAEPSLDKITGTFKEIAESKEKAEFLEAFQKSEKELSYVIKKLKQYQESLTKYEEIFEKILKRYEALKSELVGSQDFINGKNIEESIASLRDCLKAAKETLDRLAEKTSVAYQQREPLQIELEKFTLLDTFQDCEKEVEKLEKRLEKVCEISSHLSKASDLPKPTTQGIITFLPSFKDKLKNANDLFTTAEKHLQQLLVKTHTSLRTEGSMGTGENVPIVCLIAATSSPSSSSLVSTSLPTVVIRPETIASTTSSGLQVSSEASNEASLRKTVNGIK